MKKISLSEFRDYCADRHFNNFIFSSENQARRSVESSISMSLKFNTIKFVFNPNIIYLKNIYNDDFLKLNRVKVIKISEESSLLGEVFTVVCGDSSEESNDKEYTLILR